jgi:hypothetical protein
MSIRLLISVDRSIRLAIILFQLVDSSIIDRFTVNAALFLPTSDAYPYEDKSTKHTPMKRHLATIESVMPIIDIAVSDAQVSG